MNFEKRNKLKNLADLNLIKSFMNHFSYLVYSVISSVFGA